MNESIFPPRSLLMGEGHPILVRAELTDALLSHASAVGANTVQIDVAGTDSVMAIVLAMKDVLPFPDWCGSGWDSMDDAFEELQEAWGFPMFFIVRGLDVLLTRHPHIALQSVLYFEDLRKAFAREGNVFHVVYLWATLQG